MGQFLTIAFLIDPPLFTRASKKFIIKQEHVGAVCGKNWRGSLEQNIAETERKERRKKLRSRQGRPPRKQKPIKYYVRASLRTEGRKKRVTWTVLVCNNSYGE